MADLAETQNGLHRDLARYVNGCALSRGARICGLLSPGLTYQHHARTVASRFEKMRMALDAVPPSPEKVVEVPPYAGKNAFVHRMMNGAAALADVLFGAYVHGSLATGEEIAYSDFDGLVILRDDVVATPHRLSAAGLALNDLRREMFAFDPLQHHGWFILTETDLRHFCDEYFPAAIFPYTRSLLERQGTRITLHPRDCSAESRATLARALGNVSRRCGQRHRPTDMLALKSALSEIMLLPALYLQARYGTSVYKKASFEQAARDFAAADWSVMDEISQLRHDWHYDLQPLQKLALTTTVRARKLATRWFAPAIPPDIAARLTPEFWTRVARLARAIAEVASMPALSHGEHASARADGPDFRPPAG